MSPRNSFVSVGVTAIAIALFLWLTADHSPLVTRGSSQGSSIAPPEDSPELTEPALSELELIPAPSEPAVAPPEKSNPRPKPDPPTNPALAAVVGSVLFDAGDPIPNLPVLLFRDPGDRLIEHARTLTNQHGHYRFDDLTPGDYAIDLDVSNLDVSSSYLRSFKLAAGQTYRALTFSQDFVHRISGRLLGEQGGGAIVGASIYANAKRVGSTDERGYFDGLVSGPQAKLEFSVTLPTSGERRDLVVLEPANQPLSDLTFYCCEVGSLQGVVVDAWGRPVPRVTVRITRQDLGVRVNDVFTDQRGQFSIPVLFCGEVDLHVESIELGRGALDGVSVNSQGTTVEIVVSRGGSITGMVADSSGAPVVGAAVFATTRRGERWEVMTSAAGTFELTGLPSSTYELSAVSPGHAESRQTMTLTAPGVVEVSFTQTPLAEGAIQVVVSGDDAMRVVRSRLRVWVTGPGGTRTAYDASFFGALSLATDGKSQYRVVAELSGAAFARSDEVIVVAGRDDHVELELPDLRAVVVQAVDDLGRHLEHRGPIEIRRSGAKEVLTRIEDRDEIVFVTLGDGEYEFSTEARGVTVRERFTVSGAGNYVRLIRPSS